MKYIIQPCPFCEGEMTELITDENDNHAVYCGDCHATGPTAGSKEAAVNAWNERG